MTAKHEDTRRDPNNPAGNPGVAGSKRPDRPEDEDPTHPGQLNRDNVNPNAKHANPPPPASGEMLSINEPPGSQPAQSAEGHKEAQGTNPDRDRGGKNDNDDDDDDGDEHKKASKGRHR